MKNKICVVLCNFLMVAGCAKTVESENVRTSDIHGSINVVAEEASTTVEVSLRATTGIFGEWIVLSEGDQLIATMSGNTISLSKNEKRYSGVLMGSEDNAVVRVSLIRDNNMDAPNSTVVLPANFNIEAPESNESFSRGDSITAAWSPADPNSSVTINYKFHCRLDSNSGLDSNKFYVVEDTGTHTTTIDEILNVRIDNDFQNGVPCPMEITIGRRNYGDTDVALVLFADTVADREKSLTVNVIP